ncbi:MAG: ABC transporter substrate-binding protein [Peptostreptococcaceae bacterium]|nr:ABC transporter substrate-binding protein [Peptostreptococcaceae bacterium]
MKRLKKVLAGLMAAALFVSATGCGQQKTAETEKAHLNFGCYVYSTSFDPAHYQNAAWQSMRLGITETLFKFNDDGSIKPWIADEHKVSDDHKTWTFHIADGVKFSNGKVCDAQAVADSLNRLFNVSVGEKYSSTPYQYLDMESITADNEKNEVTIVTKRPYADLRGSLAFPFYAIIDVEGDLTDEKHPEGYATSVIGTGPYILTSFDDVSKSGELAKNENFWSGEVPYDTVSVTFIEDDTTKALALKNGDIDLTENITTTSDLKSLIDDPNYHVSIKNGVRTGFAYVNFDGILKNDDLRHAVFMAVDGPTLCDVTVGGIYSYGPGILPQNLVYEDDDLKDPYSYNEAGAIKILDDAGIVDTDGDGIRELDGKNIELRFVTYKNRRLSDFAEAIQLQLSKIGIGVAVNVTDSDTNWMLMQAGEYDLLNQNWTTVATGDPTNFLLNWYGDGGKNFYSESNPDASNYCKYDNAEYNKLYEQFRSSTDEKERNQLIVDIEQILIDDAAVLVHGYYKSSMISNKAKVSGAEISSFDYYWLSTDIKPAA